MWNCQIGLGPKHSYYSAVRITPIPDTLKAPEDPFPNLGSQFLLEPLLTPLADQVVETLFCNNNPSEF